MDCNIFYSSKTAKIDSNFTNISFNILYLSNTNPPVKNILMTAISFLIYCTLTTPEENLWVY